MNVDRSHRYISFCHDKQEEKAKPLLHENALLLEAQGIRTHEIPQNSCSAPKFTYMCMFVYEVHG